MIYRKMLEGTSPLRIKLGANNSGWREAELNRWINSPSSYKIAVREEQPELGKPVSSGREAFQQSYL
jgi:hypothetical protein